MGNVVDVGHFGLYAKYVPKARYNKLGDYVEYIREDKPYIMRRIDRVLTIALDMETRKPAGFRIKGFKNFFLKHFSPRNKLLDQQFLALVAIIEVAATKLGDDTFTGQEEKRSAYLGAYDIALNDRVTLDDLPKAA